MSSGDGLLPAGVQSPADLQGALAASRYLADTGLATAVFLSLALSRPLLLEGEAGVGKTELAKTVAGLLEAPLVRLQCYEGIDATQALYDWDFTRQVLHLRTVEALGDDRGDSAATETDLYDRRFLIQRPLLRALETTPSVLLIDELDRADDEFEAFLLELLSDFSVTIPEFGTVVASRPPAVIITSNRTRELHDALKRRCYYHWIDHPGFEREVDIVRLRHPAAVQRLVEQVVAATQALRRADLLKPPGVAETIDWTAALVRLGATELDDDIADATLGAVLKHREDLDYVRRGDVTGLFDAS